MDKNIDPRLITPSYINKPDVRFFGAEGEPFSLHGVIKSEKGYRRLPEEISAKVNTRARKFSGATSGGRIRFATDSSYIAIRAHLGDIYRISMLTLTLSAGFDLYSGEEFLGAFNPPYEIQSGGVYEAVINLGSGIGPGRREVRELTLYMPAYSEVLELEIGVDREAKLFPAVDYSLKSPIVFYGSSITHGACASRPGLTFPNIISRAIDAEIYNLGFGAGCRGELSLAEYITALKPSAAVVAYDHNAPNANKLLETHGSFYETLRASSPHLPIILVSRPDVHENEDGNRRFEIIKGTYDGAVLSGDRAVFLVDGRELLSAAEHTSDGIHPNDIGEREIAKKLEKIIRIAVNVNNY